MSAEDPSGPQPETTSHALEILVERARAFGCTPVTFQTGNTILREGDKNRSLYILLNGEVQLFKEDTGGQALELDRLGPGSLLGILSFWTGRTSFSHSRAKTAVECLVISQAQFEEAVAGDPEFARVTLQLLVANLSDRYRRVVGLNIKVAGLTRDLEQERNALQEAVSDLKQTRNQLVHREKLATMGQLLAGIAHEINNPSSSLLQNVATLSRTLPDLFVGDEDCRKAFESGQKTSFVSTGESRIRMEELQKAFPSMPRSRCRRLSRLSPDILSDLGGRLQDGDQEQVDRVVRAFELGTALHSIQVADERITRLVKSLKSYSRQDETDAASVDLVQCIQDTLTVLNHRLKHYDVRLELPELPEVPGRAGEINQILTNLLSNACEATPKGKLIQLEAGEDTDRVWVEISDEGCGIPEHLSDRIFEPNVTTKSGGGQYGLGLGLAISRDLAMEHGGALTARTGEPGGAVFRLELPRA